MNFNYYLIYAFISLVGAIFFIFKAIYDKKISLLYLISILILIIQGFVIIFNILFT